MAYHGWFTQGLVVRGRVSESHTIRVTEAGSYLRLIEICITQLKAQGPSRTCNESKEEEADTIRVAHGAEAQVRRPGVSLEIERVSD